MALLRKILKWLGVLVGVVLLLGVAFVWLILGVSPLEGDVDRLWELVTSEVHFFVRFPGSRVLHTDLAQGLQDKPGYAFLGEVRDDLAELTRQVARDVNPQIPLGLVEVDFERDFVGKEMAIAGTIGADYSRPRLDNFVVLTRIAWYGRFVSALKEGWVRKGLPDGARLEWRKGSYFRYALDAEQARLLAQIRAQRGGRPPGNDIYIARIKDVLILSDAPEWIEDAIRGGQKMLKADAWFETEFIRRHRPDDIELFLRHHMTANMMIQHGNPERGGSLAPISRVVPWSMTGDMTVQARLQSDGLAVRLSNEPPPEGYSKVTKEHLQNLYEREKGDLRRDLSENGIGKLAPRRRAVGVAVFHADPEDLVDLILDYMSRSDRSNLEDQVRDTGRKRNSRFRDVRSLLAELTEDLTDTHMVVINRPSVFETASFTSFVDPDWPPTPQGQFTYTLVSHVKDSARPDKVREKLFRHLEYLGLNSKGVHKSGGFHLADPIINVEGDYPLLHPAYGAVGESKYIILSYDVEGAEAVFEAARNPEERLIADPGFRMAMARVEPRGNFALVVRGDMLHRALGDQVRERARDYLDRPGMEQKWWQEEVAANNRRPPDKKLSDGEMTRRVVARGDQYVAEKYPEFRDLWANGIAFLEAVDTAAITCTLGIGPTKQIRAQAFFLFRTEDEAAPAGE
ncbi:MAG: hypothetical protein ACYSUM_17550 [Planctomycetota bacterium]|jgi:hypothetical protein